MLHPQQTTTREQGALPSSRRATRLCFICCLQECAFVGVAVILLPVSTAKVVFANKRNA